MKYLFLLKSNSLILVVLGMFFTEVSIAQTASNEELVSTTTMEKWIQELYEIGVAGKYGYRLPGTPAAHKGAEFIVEKFKEFGLQNAFIEQTDEPLSMPEEWKLTVRSSNQEMEIPCHFLRYAGFTPQKGVSAQMIHVGNASDNELEVAHKKYNLRGKIIVVDLESMKSRVTPEPHFIYDPENTLPDSFQKNRVSENWPIANLASSYASAQKYGAIGYVGILNFTAKDNNQFLHWYANKSIPGLFISANDGRSLKKFLNAGTANATMVLTGVHEKGPISHAFGVLPGLSDETIIVHTHHDGWAVNEASGVSVVLALAKYFAQIPRENRKRTLQFVALDSHFGLRPGRPKYWTELLGKTVAIINIEMIAKEYKIIDGEYVSTGLSSPTLFGVINASETMRTYVHDAIVEHDLRRSAIIDYPLGEAGIYLKHGVPSIERIAHNAPQFTKDDTPETVMVEILRPTAAAFVDIINKIDTTPVDAIKK